MIIFMGVAGAGKSSQGRRIADEKGLPWLSTGEFLRMMIAGKRRHDMLAGKLLPDKEIIGLIRKIFSVIDTNAEFVLDGFPRTAAQADWLLSQVKHGQLAITAVVHIKAPEEAVKKRLLSRGRPDDTETSIEERFKDYEDEVLPILENLQAAGVRIIDIDGNQPVDDVYANIKAALKEDK